MGSSVELDRLRWLATAALLGAALIAAPSPTARAEGPPQLGKSPIRDVIAAMTREEKVGLVMGTGLRQTPSFTRAAESSDRSSR